MVAGRVRFAQVSRWVTTISLITSGILSNPPQAQQTIDVGGTGQANDCCPGTGFLASGGIGPTPTGGLTDPVVLRQVTASFIPDQKVPYSLTYTASFQREYHHDWSVE